MKNNYNVNDTIWLEMAIRQKLENVITGELINVGYHNFQVDMNILELLDSSWIDGTHKIDIIPSIGEIEITGITYPEIIPHLVQFHDKGIQKWKFGIIPKQSNIELVLLFGKRDPNGWHGEFRFPHDNCIYGMATSTFLTNEGSIDYDSYVIKYPFFKESGNGPNISQNHRDSGAFFINVD